MESGWACFVVRVLNPRGIKVFNNQIKKSCLWLNFLSIHSSVAGLWIVTLWCHHSVGLWTWQWSFPNRVPYSEFVHRLPFFGPSFHSCELCPRNHVVGRRSEPTTWLPAIPGTLQGAEAAPRRLLSLPLCFGYRKLLNHMCADEPRFCEAALPSGHLDRSGLLNMFGTWLCLPPASVH